MFKNGSFRYSLFKIIVATGIVRCILALLLNLGNDEVYYFTYAVQPDWNHFDHPPLVGLFIRLFTLNLHWINDLSMRLPAIIGAGISTWLIAFCGKKLKNKEAGLIAAVLYNTSLYTGIISGLFILPDSIQVVFWLAALTTMLHIIDDETPARRNRDLLWLGCWIGLAIMCKVHGIFLWLGFLGFLVLYRSHWLKNPFLYLSLLITIVIISPIVFWNIENQFASWQFHSDRVGMHQGINYKAFFTTTIGQIIYNNPFNFIIAILALGSLRKQKTHIELPKLRLLLWCSVPIITATTAASLFKTTLPHWSGPGFIGIILLSAAYLAEKKEIGSNRNNTKLLNGAIAFTLFAIVIGTAAIRYYPGTLAEKSEPFSGSGDATLDMYGWDELLPQFQKMRLNDISKGVMPKNAPLLINKWFPGGHLYYYVAYPLQMKVIGVGSVNDLHKFIWLNKLQEGVKQGSDAYFISPTNNFTDPSDIYKGQFESIELAVKIPCLRNGKTARYWYVYRLKNAAFRWTKKDKLTII